MGRPGVLIQITPQLRILVAIEPIDARKGIDRLAQLCREKLAADPFSGCLFIFRSRRGTAIKLLAYDGQGVWLATEAFVEGTASAGGPRVTNRRGYCERIRRSCCWRPAIPRSGSRALSGGA